MSLGVLYCLKTCFTWIMCFELQLLVIYLRKFKSISMCDLGTSTMRLELGNLSLNFERRVNKIKGAWPRWTVPSDCVLKVRYTDSFHGTSWQALTQSAAIPQILVSQFGECHLTRENFVEIILDWKKCIIVISLVLADGSAGIGRRSIMVTLHERYFSNHKQLDCLFNSFFSLTSTKPSDQQQSDRNN